MQKTLAIVLIIVIPFLFGSFVPANQQDTIKNSEVACGPSHHVWNRGPAGSIVYEVRYGGETFTIDLTPDNRVYIGTGFSLSNNVMVRIGGAFTRVFIWNETMGEELASLDYSPSAPQGKYFFNNMSFTCATHYVVTVQ